jgi:hypothetical protein
VVEEKSALCEIRGDIQSALFFEAPLGIPTTPLSDLKSQIPNLKSAVQSFSERL